MQKEIFSSLKKAFFFFCFLSACPSFADVAIFSYENFLTEEDALPSISLEDFESHLRILQKKEYHVLSLPDFINTLKSTEKFPKKGIVLTFDHASLSIWEQAVPRLQATGFPFTIFVNPTLIDSQRQGYMSWDQLRTLHKKGVTFGLTIDLPPSSQKEQLHIINHAMTRFHEEFGMLPHYFVYPQGIYTSSLKDLIKSRHFEAAFGQDASPASLGMDPYLLPRFVMTGLYADPERFQIITNSLALPVSNLRFSYHSEKEPEISFSVKADFPNLEQLSCFAKTIGRLPVQMTKNRHFYIRLPHASPIIRIHCMLPSMNKKQKRWYWFGRVFKY